MWAALLHDISKRCMPDFEGKDHVHPFISALTTLKIFVHLKIIKLENQAQIDEFDRLLQLIRDSKQPVQKVWKDVKPTDNLCQDIHSHHLL